MPWRWYFRSNLMKKFSDAANTKLRRHNWFFIILLDSLRNRPQFIGCWSGPFWLFSTIFLFLKTPWQWSTVDFNSGHNLSLGIRFHSWSLTIWIGNIIHQKNVIPLRFQSNPLEFLCLSTGCKSKNSQKYPNLEILGDLISSHFLFELGVSNYSKVQSFGLLPENVTRFGLGLQTWSKFWLLQC